MQTSITTWLKKPASVTQPQPQPQPPPTPPTSQAQTPTEVPSESDTNNHPPTPPPINLPLAEPLPPNSTNHTSPPSPTLPYTQTLPPLPPSITLSPCLTPHIPSFKRLNTLLLPIPYPKKFYEEITSDPTTSELTLLALCHDSPTTPPRVIGAIRCRLLPDAEVAHPLLYISTLGVLAPYRRYGVATHLLQVVLVRAVRKFGVRAVGAHVWKNNEEGRGWYAKRGFKETHLEEGYYRRLQPQGAWVVRRDVGVRDLMLGL